MKTIKTGCIFVLFLTLLFIAPLHSRGEDNASADAAAGYLRRGASNMAEGDYTVAIMNLNMALALKPDLAQARYARGLAFEMTGDKKRAAEDYTAAIDGAPRYAEPRLRRGGLSLKAGDVEAALEDFDKAIKYFDDAVSVEGEKNTGRIRAYIGRALANGKKGDFKRAIKDFDAAMGMNPDEPDLLSARLGRGLALLENNDDAKAAKDFNAVLASTPENRFAHYQLGRIYSRAGDEEEACSHLLSAADDADKNFSQKAAAEKDFDSIREKECYKEAVAKGAIEKEIKADAAPVKKK